MGKYSFVPMPSVARALATELFLYVLQSASSAKANVSIEWCNALATTHSLFIGANNHMWMFRSQTE